MELHPREGVQTTKTPEADGCPTENDRAMAEAGGLAGWGEGPLSRKAGRIQPSLGQGRAREQGFHLPGVLVNEQAGQGGRSLVGWGQW